MVFSGLAWLPLYWCESAKDERKLNSSLEGQVTVINPELAAYPGHLWGEIDIIPISPPLYIDAGGWNSGGVIPIATVGMGAYAASLTQSRRETERRKGETWGGAMRKEDNDYKEYCKSRKESRVNIQPVGSTGEVEEKSMEDFLGRRGEVPERRCLHLKSKARRRENTGYK